MAIMDGKKVIAARNRTLRLNCPSKSLIKIKSKDARTVWLGLEGEK